MDLPPLPTTAIVQPSTNRYHLTFAWDGVTNARWYAVIVKKDGVEQFRRYSMTNLLTVSNLEANLDHYSFTAIATNSLGESAESVPAPKKLVVITDGPHSLTLEPTNQNLFLTNLHPVAISNYNAASQLRKD